MTTVLDTDVLSELRLPNPDPSVSAWFAAQPQADLAIASLTVAEIEHGIALVSPQNGNLATQLATWLDAILATQRVLPLDGAAGRLLGRLHAVPALRHLATTSPQARKPRFAGDLAIAATVVSHNGSVATRNIADFGLIAIHCPGLIGINPWTGQTF